jgi:hypothetical protein
MMLWDFHFLQQTTSSPLRGILASLWM